MPEKKKLPVGIDNFEKKSKTTSIMSIKQK